MHAESSSSSSLMGEASSLNRERLSDAVRSLHDKLSFDFSVHSKRASDGRGPDDEAVGDAMNTWATIRDAVPEESSATYAEAMSHLFSNCWEGTEYVVDALTQHFHQGKRESHGVCGRAAGALKAKRQEYFSLHQHVMPEEDVVTLVSQLNAVYHRERILVLDVGSCHGGLFASAPSWMDVVAVDLRPSVAAAQQVLQGDWLAVDVRPPSASLVSSSRILFECVETDKEANHEDVQHTPRHLMSVAPRSIDAVVFCYMLSYLPSGLLRWESCRRAVDVLKRYDHGKGAGVILILEPRRGAHHKRWEAKWITLLEHSLGLLCVRREVLLHSVSLMFTLDMEGKNGDGQPVSLDFR